MGCDHSKMFASTVESPRKERVKTKKNNSSKKKHQSTSDQEIKEAKVIFVIGGPGSGKGTQCEKIATKYKCHHISAGDLLREEVKSESPLGKECAELMKEGQLISVEIINSILKQKMKKLDARKHYLIDGFPRSVDQAIKFENEISECNLVLYFECDEEVMIERIMERSKTSGREDDNLETIKKRLKTFEETSAAVTDYYKEKNKCQVVKADKDPDAIFGDVEAVLEEFFKIKEISDEMKVIFVLGGPGCGKGTQCERIKKDYNCEHISAGDLLREEVASGSELGKQCSELMKEGKLVPMEITVSLLKNAMIKSNAKNFLIDGFPRAIDQAEIFEKEIKECGMVLYFECDEDVMVERIMERAKNSGREDDNLETIKKRLKTFAEMSAPVADYYEKQGKCTLISAYRSPSEIYVDVKKCLNQYFNQKSKTLNIIELGKCESNDKIEDFIEKLKKRNLNVNYLTLSDIIPTSTSSEDDNSFLHNSDLCLLMNLSSYMKEFDVENIITKLSSYNKTIIPKFSVLKTMIHSIPQLSTLKLGKPDSFKYDTFDQLKEGLIVTLTKNKERDLLINGSYWNITLKDISLITDDNDKINTETIILVNQNDNNDGIKEELSIENYINTLKSKYETYTEISILDTPSRPLRKDNVIELHFIYDKLFKLSHNNFEEIKNIFMNDDWLNFLSICNLDACDLPAFWTIEFIEREANEYEIDNFKCDILSMLTNDDDCDLDHLIDLFSKRLIQEVN